MLLQRIKKRQRADNTLLMAHVCFSSSLKARGSVVGHRCNDVVFCLVF